MQTQNNNNHISLPKIIISQPNLFLLSRLHCVCASQSTHHITHPSRSCLCVRMCVCIPIFDVIVMHVCVHQCVCVVLSSLKTSISPKYHTCCKHTHPMHPKCASKITQPKTTTTTRGEKRRQIQKLSVNQMCGPNLNHPTCVSIIHFAEDKRGNEKW